MKRLAISLGVLSVLTVAVILARPEGSTSTPAAGEGALNITVEAKNPWTNLKLNDDPDQFQFAVVTDRTGGHRAKVFSRAVHQVNLLQPTFVMSVGDLIEGYSLDPERANAQWDEFDSYVKNFRMPFFYVGGNHDLTNGKQAEVWESRYGRKVYHFVYKNTLFLALNSEDGAASTVQPEQHAYVKKALAENPNVRWTFVFLHKPLWTAKDLDKNGFGEIEKLLAGRKYTMFCGHVHRYQKFVRNGMNYYQLATTGGSSRLRGVQYGEFDHVAWVTMKNDGPLIANVLLDGILPENLQLPDVNEPGTVPKKRPTYPVAGSVTLDGKPLAGVTVRLTETGPKAGKTPLVADALTDETGRFLLTTYTRNDGCPEGEFLVSVYRIPGGPGVPVSDEPAPSDIPEKYATGKSTLKLNVKPSTNDVKLDLTTAP